ncbi:hypothetical protein GCM10022268_10130 [Sphingomonas cynarae]|uniref:M23ase beta-sheet core domain-containing protein n=1 Tax=Sphingomonas cynarae TaxID=930197 RepID=A0ABP7D8H0_9SPHN
MTARAIGVVAMALLCGASLPAAPPMPVDRPDVVAIAGLLATMQAAGRPPVIAMLVQPGSIDDLIHLRAVLAGLRPELTSRLARLRHRSVTNPSDARQDDRAASVYRLPVTGQLVTGFGTLSQAGVRSRGLTFAVAPGSPVVAPAGGVVRYAQAFRGYGGTVIVDHGAGWTSVLTGLGTLAVRPGSRVSGGAAIGTARRGGRPHVTVELRRRGEPVDAAALIH